MLRPFGNPDRPDGLARKGLEARTGEEFREVGDFEGISQVRLVGSEAPHRFFICEARERNRRSDARRGELFEESREQSLDRGEDILLRDEAHLEIELIELAG